MSLTGKDVAEIARLLAESRFSSLDLKMGDFKLRIRRDGAGGSDRWAAEGDEAGEERPQADASAGIQSPPSAPPAQSAAPAGDAAPGEVEVTAPLLGNYYAAPRPGEDPFVKVGDKVEPDTVIAIIEVMKLMNSVRAGVSGTVTAVLVENGSAVEKGQPLIRVKVD